MSKAPVLYSLLDIEVKISPRSWWGQENDAPNDWYWTYREAWDLLQNKVPLTFPYFSPSHHRQRLLQNSFIGMTESAKSRTKLPSNSWLKFHSDKMNVILLEEKLKPVNTFGLLSHSSVLCFGPIENHLKSIISFVGSKDCVQGHRIFPRMIPATPPPCFSYIQFSWYSS